MAGKLPDWPYYSTGVLRIRDCEAGAKQIKSRRESVSIMRSPTTTGDVVAWAVSVVSDQSCFPVAAESIVSVA
jgi:hypothetical protein